VILKRFRSAAKIPLKRKMPVSPVESQFYDRHSPLNQHRVKKPTFDGSFGCVGGANHGQNGGAIGVQITPISVRSRTWRFP
jgi:hypothetical protein